MNMKCIPVGLSHCNFEIACNHSITKLIMGKTESNVERGKPDKYCNCPCEKQCYFELLVIALQGDQIEIGLNCIL